ncbi:hypothetical protein JZK55_07240 [Dissulfurispira thermophila]|uniref:Uncharacterized protein n=2 Tax=root TaxID=1 RepID=A0A7G1H0H2_9BACT|nr:hypothetical protein [Dissulfurispira thermophila]BCB95802.1 hypothetical protein JZK55_07240 [Dissulfurispira thermophila]
MARFEELQMTIAESAKNYLDIFNMQVLIEQFTLDREGKFFLTLPNMEQPFPVSATVSFVYDAFQTGMTLYEDNEPDENSDVDTSVELEFTVKLPFMKDYPDIELLLDEINEEYPDTEPILTIKEIVGGDEPFREYEIHYSYGIDIEDTKDSELFDDIFQELKDMMELIYERTENYIDQSWYGGEEQ